MSQSGQSFIEALCDFRSAIQFVFVVALLFFLFMFLTLVFADPDSGTFAIALLNVVGLGTYLLGAGLVVRKCNQLR